MLAHSFALKLCNLHVLSAFTCTTKVVPCITIYLSWPRSSLVVDTDDAHEIQSCEVIHPCKKHINEHLCKCVKHWNPGRPSFRHVSSTVYTDMEKSNGEHIGMKMPTH